MYATQSYLLGAWPPGTRHPLRAFQAASAMLRGHALAAAVIHRLSPIHRVGIVHNLRIFEPASPAARDVAVAAMWDYLFNGALMIAIRSGRLLPPFGTGHTINHDMRASCDFFGLNYYTRERVAFSARAPGMLFGRRFTPSNVPQSDRGGDGATYGEIYPHGLYRALRRVARLKLPIYITETGLPDADDDQRPRFILDHLHAVHRALHDGVDVRGIFLWTLVDNFEWSEGWGLRFGLYALDLATGERRLRPSGALYAAIAHANAIPASQARP